MMLSLLTMVVGLMPMSSGKRILLNLLGHRVAKDARVAPMLFIRVGRIEIGAGAAIGALNVVRGLSTWRVGPEARVGTLNWFSAARFLVESGESGVAGVFDLADYGTVTQRHYIDASGGVFVGRYTTIAGVKSTLMTHGIDYRTNTLEHAPIRIAEKVMLGGDCRVVMGASIPERSVVAMASCVVGELSTPACLYAGVPATARKTIEDAEYWHRTDVRVFSRNDYRRSQPH